MANLLKRNEYGGIDRVCQYPDRDGDKVLEGDCSGCTNRTRCNAAIFERLAKYEESGFEPDVFKMIASRRTVIEVCPECDAENEIVWDVETMGYEAYCPVCGAQMLLCDECIHAEDGLNENSSSCDWHKDKGGRSVCFRCKNTEE